MHGMKSGPLQSIVILCMFVLSGCTAPVEVISPPVESTAAEPLPTFLSFSASTLERTVDQGDQHDLRNSFEGPILLIWVAAGCNGCHDWTDMVREGLQNGSIDNSTNIVSVHRYAEFESKESVMNVYGDNNSSHYAPWPVLMPTPSTRVINASSGRMTDFGLYEAFDNPVTPTIQVIDEAGRLAWTSKHYWANSTVLDEALNIMEGGRE